MLHIGIILNDVHLSWMFGDGTVTSFYFVWTTCSLSLSLSRFSLYIQKQFMFFLFPYIKYKTKWNAKLRALFYLGKSVNYRHAMHKIRIVTTTCTIELEIYLCYYHPSKWFVLETVYRYMCFRRHLYCQSWIMIENTQW